MEMTKNIISAFPVAPIAIDFKEGKNRERLITLFRREKDVKFDVTP